MKPAHFRDAGIAAWRELLPSQPVGELVNDRFKCSGRIRLRRTIGRRQTSRHEELMSQHPRQDFPLKSLVPPHGFDVTLEPGEPCPQSFLSCSGTAAVQPGFERFHEQLRTCPPRPSGDAIQPGAKLLRHEELMPNLLRLHAEPRCWRDVTNSYCG